MSKVTAYVDFKPDFSQVTKAVKPAAGKAADEFTRDVNGKLRDARGRFVKGGEAVGEGVKRGWWRGSSGMFGRFSRDADSSFGRFRRRASDTFSGVTSTASRALGGVWGRFSRDASSAFGAVQGMASRAVDGIGSMFNRAKLGALLLGGIATASGFGRLMTIEDARTSLTTIMGDAAMAGSLIDNIVDVVTGTPFNLDQFATAGKNLIAFGVSASKVPGYLTAIGEAAAASGKGMAGVDAITGAFGKIAASGQVSLSEVWSISDAGVNALGVLANGFSVTTDEMKDMISAGAVPAEKALDILAKGIVEGSDGIAGSTVALGGAMEALRKTTRGSIGGAKAALARFGANLIEPIFGAIPDILGRFSAALDTAGKAWVGLASTFRAEGALAGFDALRSMVDRLGVGGAPRKAIAWMVNAAEQGYRLFAMFRSGDADAQGFAEILDNVAGNTGRLVGPLRRVYDIGGKVIDQVRNNLTPLFAGLAAVAGSLAGPRALGQVVRVVRILGVVLTSPVLWLALLAGGLVLAYQKIEPFRDAVDRVAGVMRDGLGVALQWVTGTAIPGLRQGWDDLTAAFNTGDGDGIFGTVGAKARETYDWITGTAIPGIKTAFSDLVDGFNTGDGEGFFGALGQKGRETYDWIIGTALPGIQQAAGSFLAGLRGEGGDGSSFFTDLGEGIVTFVDWLDETVLPAGQRVVGWLKDDLLPAVQGLFDWLTGDGKPVLAGFAAAIGLLVAPITTVVVGFVVLYQRFSWFRTGVATVLGAVRGYFTRVWLPTFVFAWNTAKTYIGLVRDYIDLVGPWVSRVFGLVRGYVARVWWPTFQRVWSVVQTAFKAIGTALRSAWSNVIQPVFRAVSWTITNVTIPMFRRLWSFLSGFVFPLIVAAIKDAWTKIGPIFTAVVGYVRDTLIPRFVAIKDTATTAFHTVRDTISSVWDRIKPKLQALVDFVTTTVVPIWGRISGAVSGAFDSIPRVIQSALRVAGNVVAGFLGSAAGVADTIGLDHIAGSLRGAQQKADAWGEGGVGNGSTRLGGNPVGGFADGGRIRGGIPGKDSVPILAMADEFVQRRSAVRKWGVSAMDHLNRGEAPPGWVIPGYAEGGLIGWGKDRIAGAVSGLRGLAAKGLEKAWPELPWGPFQVPVDGLLGVIPGALNRLRDEALEFIGGKAEEQENSGLEASSGGLNPEFLRRFNAYSAAVGGLRIVSGYRSRAQQAEMYRRYLVGTGNLAAPPGRSKHEQGLAIDHAPRATVGMQAIARNYRLHYPVRGEPWHVEPYAQGGLVSLHRTPFDTGGVLEPGWNVVKNVTGAKEALHRTSETHVTFRVDGGELAAEFAAVIDGRIEDHDGEEHRLVRTGDGRHG